MEAKKAFMDKAIKLAKKNNSIYGAVVVRDGEIIANGANRKDEENDPTAHAEIMAIRTATRKLGSAYLPDCILYSTAEPCPMCTAAAIWAKMGGIVFGSNIDDLARINKKRQIHVRCIDIAKHGEPTIEVIENFCRDECNLL